MAALHTNAQMHHLSSANVTLLYTRSQLNLSELDRTAVPEDVMFKQNLKRYAYGYVMLVLCAAGVLGNVLALTVLTRKSMRTSSTATYLRCLAAVDALVLLLAVFRYRSYYVFLSEPEVIHTIMTFDRLVQVYIAPIFWIFLGVSSFLTLSLSLERYLVIRWPFTLQRSYRVTGMRALTVISVLAVFLVTSPHFLCYKVRTTTFRQLKVVVVVLNNDYLDARWYLHCFSHYLMPLTWYMLPWVCLAAVNTLLVLQVRKSSRIRVGVPNSLNPNRNLSILVILIVGVYMICNFPRCILEIFCLVNNCSSGSSSDSDDGMGDHSRAFHVTIAIADTLNLLNSCLNIVVYCATGARFRRELRLLLFCSMTRCKQRPPLPRTHPSLHVTLRDARPTQPCEAPKDSTFPCRQLQLGRLCHRPEPHFGSSCSLQRPASGLPATCRRHLRQTSSFSSLTQLRDRDKKQGHPQNLGNALSPSSAMSSVCPHRPMMSSTSLHDDSGNVAFLPSSFLQSSRNSRRVSRDVCCPHCPIDLDKGKLGGALPCTAGEEAMTSLPAGIKTDASRIFTVLCATEDAPNRALDLL